MSYEIRNYDIANPYELFALTSGLMLRDKLKTEVLVKDPEMSDDSLIHIVLHDNSNNSDVKWEPLKLCIKNSEGIQESYVMNLANIEKDINEDSLTTYFYYFGKLLGQFTFLNLFHRNTELTFLEDYYLKTKTYLEIMIRSFPAFSSKYMEVIASDEEKNNPEAFETCKMFLELNQSFSFDISEIEKFTKYENTYVPVSTLLALNYIGLFYTIFGIITNSRNKNNGTLRDFIQKGYENMIEQTFESLILGDNIKAFKLDSLLYTFKVLTDFYSHGGIFIVDYVKNKTYHCFYNISNHIEKYLLDETKTDGKEIIIEIVGNTIFNIEPNLISFCQATHWIEPEKLNFGIASECDNPIIYFNTLSHFLFSSNLYISSGDNENKKLPNNLFSMISYDGILKNALNLNKKVSFKMLKLFVENLLVTDFNIISPKIIFKLIYIASFARIYLHDKSVLSSFDIQDGEYAYDTIVISEIAIFYLYQEWFNRKNKIYRYEKRVYTVKIDKNANVIDPLKYESLISIVEYLNLIMFFQKTKYPSALGNLNTSQFNELLHDEYRSHEKSFNSIKKYVEKIGTILSTIENDEDYSIDLMMETVKGKLGLLFGFLSNVDKDILIDIMTNKTPITKFFSMLEIKDPEDENNRMVKLLSNLKIDNEIVGKTSDNEVYKKINSNIKEIFNSDLNNYQKFYLIYCLNYQYIKNNQYSLIASGIDDPNVLVINKTQTLNEERGILNTLESLSDELLSNPIEKSQKYGFDL